MKLHSAVLAILSASVMVPVALQAQQPVQSETASSTIQSCPYLKPRPQSAFRRPNSRRLKETL
jgi:hypothetical protein